MTDSPQKSQTSPNKTANKGDNTFDNSHLDQSISSRNSNGFDQAHCPHCQELEAKVKLLEESILKLGEKTKESKTKNKSLTGGKDNSQQSQIKRRTLPFDPNAYKADLQAERRRLKQLEEQAQKLKERERKERRLLKSMLEMRAAFSESSFKKVKGDRSATKHKTEGIKSGSSEKVKGLSSSMVEKYNAEGDQFEENLNQIMMQSKVSAPDSEKSDLSSSITSEKREMIEKMTPEERDAYYSKNMKNRKMMAKQKKHKRK